MPTGLVFGIVAAVPFAFVLWRLPDAFFPWVVAWLFAGLPVLLIGARIIRRQIDHEDKELEVFGASEAGREKYLRMRQKHSRATRGPGRKASIEVVQINSDGMRFNNVS